MPRLITAFLLATILLFPAFSFAEAASRPFDYRVGPQMPAEAGAERLVLAYYYAWFDQNTWRPDVVADMPVTPYQSADRATMVRQVDQAKAAGIDGFILGWLGPNNPTDSNLATLLSVAQEKGFRVALGFETDSPFLGSQEAIVGALRYAIGQYGGHPALLRHQGQPVILFWRTRQFSVNAWQQIRDQVDPNRSTTWIAEGDNAAYLQAFDGMNMYSIAWSADVWNTLSSFAAKVASWQRQLGTPKIWAATVMPGYDDRKTGRTDAFVRDRQDGQFYRSTWDAATATAPDWIVITSFNEWVEGSQIEPSVSYGDKYLNLTKELAARFKGSSRPIPETPPSAAATASGSYFFAQDGQPPGSQLVGFVVSNDDGVRLWDEFQRLGGVGGLGYPISYRFMWNGFLVQVMQKGVLQWRPDVGKAYLVNIFDLMSDAGKDDWLLAVRSVPQPLGPEFDAGKAAADVVKDRLALLDANPAIKQRYFAVGDPLTVYGLPTSRVEDLGSHYAMRFQRAVIQQWKVDTPWARAGDVVVANGGEIGKEAGLFSGDVLTPKAPPK